MALAHNKRGIGVFSSHQAAEAALNELQTHGFAMNQVSVVARNTDKLEQSDRIGDANVQDLTERTQVDEGARTGAATGGVVGGLTGLLVGLGTLAIPGVGPIMLAGATATALATTAAGGAIGAATGGIVGGLVGLGIPEERAQHYQDRVAGGEYLVIIDGTDTDILRASGMLMQHGVQHWEVFDASAADGAVNEPYLG